MNQQITLRPETSNDSAAVFNIHHLAFEQDEEAKLVDALRKNAEVFMAIELIPNAMKNAGGTLIYPAEFGIE